MDETARERLAEALRRTAARDPRAYRLVYRLTAAKLFGFCLRICDERQAAENVLQGVFLTVWMQPAGFYANRGSAIAWLATIARNRSIGAVRPNAPAGNEDGIGPRDAPSA